MQLNPHCICCQISKQEEKIRHFDNKEKRLAYMQEICRRFGDAGPNDCAPSLSQEFREYFSRYWDVPMKDYTQINREFNQLLLDLEETFRTDIQNAEDPLEQALIYARTANYIDFSTIPDANHEEAVALLKKRKEERLDPVEYRNLCHDLSRAHSLVYLLDNCGELVLDKLVIELLLKLYPDLSITVIVRGAPTANDATMEDATMCRITDLVPVIGNGNNVGGTWLPGISKETRTLLNEADVLIAKGQSNYETLHECGLNIYYLFLCKCDYFTHLFQCEPLTGMLVNEQRI